MRNLSEKFKVYIERSNQFYDYTVYNSLGLEFGLSGSSEFWGMMNWPRHHVTEVISCPFDFEEAYRRVYGKLVPRGAD